MASIWAWPHHLPSLLYTAVLFVVHLAVVCRAITRPDRTPASRAAWVALIMFMPLLGVLAYLLLGETSIGRHRVRRMREAEARMPPLPAAADDRDVPPVADAAAAALFDLGRSINGFAPTGGNRIALMHDSDAAIDALVADIGAAREHVHIGFYIWLDDHNGGKVADAVAAAARRGVTCRVMVDALGSRAFVRSPRWRQLREAGAHTVAALDDVPRLGHLAMGRVDLRNHRKIAVIDNRIAYCGSQNCADPAFLPKAEFAPWVDIFFRCEGPAVRQEQHLFLISWITETGEAVEGLATAAPAPERFAGGALAQMFGTGPTTRANAMSDMFAAAMVEAREELTITTPYFVPDEPMLRALCAAARRGVRTTLILPRRNDSRLVGAASRSCYEDLLTNGVALYEYPLGLLHAKSMTLDGRIALVGSANMDRRSLQLNYENNLLIADPAVTEAIRQRQHSYLAASQPVALEAVRAWPFWRRLAQNAIGMMAPVL